MFTWRPGDFRAGASSLRFPLMNLYLFTWYHHKMSCQRESPRREFTPVVVPGENFTSVRKLATVSCKRESTTCFGLKSVCRYTGTGSAFVMFAISNHRCILSPCSVPSNNEIWNDSFIKRDTKSKSDLGMKHALVRVFSCKQPLKENRLQKLIKLIYVFVLYRSEWVQQGQVLLPSFCHLFK